VGLEGIVYDVMPKKIPPKTQLLDPALLPDATWRRAFRRRVRGWYTKHARDLPWRRTDDPYRIWVSEIMLQQTQVATVTAYFDRFLRAFPTIRALAAADEQEVLRLWEGLGYYRRARQLHRAAQVVVEQHAGRFPHDPDAVRSLPGIGRYTAGAVLSIAFDQRQPILEANTVRLFARLLGYRGVVTSSQGSRLLWAMAETILPRREVGLFNQALMELGSEVCTPRSAQCETCPAALLCRANAEGLQQTIPVNRPKPAYESLHEAAILIRRNGRLLLRQCAPTERWAGLWDFPRFPIQGQSITEIHQEIIQSVRNLTGINVEPGAQLTTLKHGVTKYRITLDCYEARYVSTTNGKTKPNDLKWLTPVELETYPLSTTGRKLAALTE